MSGGRFNARGDAPGPAWRAVLSRALESRRATDDDFSVEEANAFARQLLPEPREDYDLGNGPMGRGN